MNHQSVPLDLKEWTLKCSTTFSTPCNSHQICQAVFVAQSIQRLMSSVLSLQTSTSRTYVCSTMSGKTIVALEQTFMDLVALPLVDVDQDDGASIVHLRRR